MAEANPFDRERFDWTREGSPGGYRLLGGTEELASLTWGKGSGSRATAVAPGSHWTLKRAGFLKPRVIVRDAATDSEVAVLNAGWSESVVELADGAPLHFTRAGMWDAVWRFTDATQSELLRFEPRGSHGRLDGGAVWAHARARQHPSLPLLLVLGWYFIVVAWAEERGIATGALVAIMAGA